MANFLTFSYGDMRLIFLTLALLLGFLLSPTLIFSTSKGNKYRRYLHNFNVMTLWIKGKEFKLLMIRTGTGLGRTGQWCELIF